MRPFASPPDGAEGALSLAESAEFGVPADETVEVIVRPDMADFWMTTGILGALIWIPLAVSWLVDLSTGDPVAAGAVLAWTFVAAFLGSMFGMVAYAGGPTLVATGRGIRIRGGKLIPWKEVLSIEPTFPYVAEYRIELREGSPALEELKAPPWVRRVWARAGKRHRIVGSDGVWDIGSRRLGRLEDALDQFVLRSWSDEVAEGSGAAAEEGAASDDEAGPVKGAGLDEDTGPHRSMHAHDDE